VSPEHAVGLLLSLLLLAYLAYALLKPSASEEGEAPLTAFGWAQILFFFARFSP